MTFHTITREWTLETKCLQTTFTPESHTAVNLADGLTDALENWNLDETKLVAITTDNASNIKAAVTLLGWQWVNCFGHNLNIAVTTTMAAYKVETDRAMQVCHSVNSSLSNSWKRKKRLRELQVEMGLPIHNLITVS